MTKHKLLLCLILFGTPFFFSSSNWNNSCDDYLSYLNIYFSKNCYYIPDLYQNVEEIIRKHIGFCETHQVQTEDGYILGLFHIPRKNPKGVVLFQHGLNDDARMWVGQYDESIAFIFWKAGYDIWLGNYRGSLYSQKHVNLTAQDIEFWDYSLHELGFYDNSATVDYVRKKTNGARIIYIGYSMGGTAGVIYASTRFQEAKKSLQLMITMAPVTYIKHATSSVKFFRPLIFIGYFMQNFSVKYDNWYYSFTTIYREILINFPLKRLLVYVNSMFFGWTPDEIEPKLINLYLAQSSYYIPLRIMEHYYQIYISGGDFQMYDYGIEKNMDIYNSSGPSLYAVENITVPILLIYGDQDKLSHHKDNEIFYEKLKPEAKAGILVVEECNHLGFLIGKRKSEKIYDKITHFLNIL